MLKIKNKLTNSSKGLQTIILIVLGFIVFGLFVSLYFSFKSPALEDSVSSIKSSIPVRIRIPSINIDAPIESVGLTSLGSIDAPDGPTNTAWFDKWPRPGEKGSSIIIGHSGWKNNTPAVFDDLYKLQKGDAIYIEDESGVTITFIVNRSQKYDSKANAFDVFYSNDEESHLNLITCTGVWNQASRSRSDRLVVFTDME